jgi:S-DNA-T family DNA segregation ATPase FtsK/SpoIIIE
MLGNVSYNTEIENKIKTMQSSGSSGAGGSGGGSDMDAYFVDAGKFVIEKDKASIGMLQRVFKIGFNRAARIVDQLEEAGVVGAEEGTKPRRILMSLEQFENYVEENL